ncbi:MAG TPA: sterol-binding protein [Burkholderiales bacterium]|nr:sterol-binding protein [Burkholderiales bacterium]
MLERGAVAGLNHLLSRQPAAAERLRPFAGQGVEIRCPPFPDLRLTILESGLLARAQGATASALLVRLKPGALPLLLARDEGARGQIEIQGPADLAGAVDALVRSLAWDIEEDLSAVFGDVVARRLASGAKAVAAWQRDALLRLAENLAEYWVEEQPLLLRPGDAEKFAHEVDALGDETARLEKRIERLESAGKR